MQKHIIILASIILISVKGTGRAVDFMAQGVYEIRLAEHRGEHSYQYNHGVLTMRTSREGDRRDEASCYVHVRHPEIDLYQDSKNTQWKIARQEDGNYKIHLYDLRDEDGFSGGLLTAHRVYNTDKRERDTTYVHVRRPGDPHTSYSTWDIVPVDGEDNIYEIKLLNDEDRNQYQLLTFHNHFQDTNRARNGRMDKRTERSAYPHVRNRDAHNTRWKITLINSMEIIQEQNKKIGIQEAMLQQNTKSIARQAQMTIALYTLGGLFTANVGAQLLQIDVLTFSTVINAIGPLIAYGGVGAMCYMAGIMFSKSKLDHWFTARADVGVDIKTFVSALVEEGAFDAKATAIVERGAVDARALVTDLINKGAIQIREEVTQNSAFRLGWR